MYMRGNPLGELLFPLLVKNNCRKKNILVTGRISVKKSGTLLENKSVYAKLIGNKSADFKIPVQFGHGSVHIILQDLTVVVR